MRAPLQRQVNEKAELTQDNYNPSYLQQPRFFVIRATGQEKTGRKK